MKKVLALLIGGAMLSGAAAYVTAGPVQAEQVR
jgi:hypothetical protein